MESAIAVFNAPGLELKHCIFPKPDRAEGRTYTLLRNVSALNKVTDSEENHGDTVKLWFFRYKIKLSKSFL